MGRRVIYDPKLVSAVRRWYGKLSSRRKVAKKLGVSTGVVERVMARSGVKARVNNLNPKDECAACHHLCIMHRDGTGECLDPRCSCDAVSRVLHAQPIRTVPARARRKDRPDGRA